MVSKRECGECEVCCVSLKVPDLNKDAGIPCQFLKRPGHGCSLHGTKLQADVCNTWKCFWKRGELDEHHRPDKVGMVAFYSRESELHPRGVISLQEVESGSFQHNKEAKEAVLQISDRVGIPTVLRPISGDKVLVVPKKEGSLYQQLDHLREKLDMIKNPGFMKKLQKVIDDRKNRESK